MAVLLFGAAAGDNELIRLDDIALQKDEGSYFANHFTAAPIDFGPAGSEGTLRRIVQAMTIGGDTTVRITPIANGGEVLSDQDTHALLAADGPGQRIEQYPSSLGTRHGIKVEVTAWAGEVTAGECDLELRPDRSTEKL